MYNESKGVLDGTRNTKIGFYVQFYVYSESVNVGGVYISVGIEVRRYIGTCMIGTSMLSLQSRQLLHL